jgi:xanthine dehydrogenase accessory factor
MKPRIGYVHASDFCGIAIKGLNEHGLDEEKLSRVYSPIGLELNAETPEEIAVSILAEIIMLRNNGTGKVMKE